MHITLSEIWVIRHKDRVIFYTSFCDIVHCSFGGPNSKIPNFKLFFL